MYYKVERTYLTNEQGEYQRLHDAKPYLIPASSASAAAMAFVTHEQGKMLGAATPLPGDKATATAECGERVYVIFVERAAEAVKPG